MGQGRTVQQVTCGNMATCAVGTQTYCRRTPTKRGSSSCWTKAKSSAGEMGLGVSWEQAAHKAWVGRTTRWACPQQREMDASDASLCLCQETLCIQSIL